MTRLEAALLDLSSFLAENQIPYMVIGGFANLHWGVERFTRDLDLAIEVADNKLEDLVRRLDGRFELTRSDTVDFARLNHLIRLRTPAGVPVDLMLAVLPYQASAIRRGIEVPVGDRPVILCAPEDLIIHKLASDRPQDAVDVEGIMLRQHHRLDQNYLAPHVRDLAEGLERPEIVSFYEGLTKKMESHHG